MPTVVSAPRLRQRRPSAIESLTEPPLESSTMVTPPSWRPRAKSSKSLGLSAVTPPTPPTPPPQTRGHPPPPNLTRKFRSSRPHPARGGPPPPPHPPRK